MKIKPRAVPPGSTLGIVSPSSPIAPDKMEKGRALMHAYGYKTKLMPHALDSEFYLAGSDRHRADDLMAAFHDPEVDAVYCSRGGYGCARLFPYLDLDFMAQSRKMFLGFSDITTLHMALQRRGAVTIQAPMVLTLAFDRAPWVHESFFNVLSGDARIPKSATKMETVVPGVAEGDTVGGCLCLICDSIGTKEEIQTEGKILLIEDVDENPHRVDAMMTHLFNAGKLQSAAAVVVGEMTRTDERADESIGSKPWKDIVGDILVRSGVPSSVMFPFGHMSTMLSLPMGLRARVDTEAATFEYTEPLCDD
ncbi:MAG: LD-carboxypeptidase [Armatimonadetes bacterium]|nr:LD-carboxypeptidase [Armatimonadota bacterium]